MSNTRLQVSMVAVTMVAFLLMLIVNEWLFSRFEFARGINWIYLPAGMRLLCILLFAEAGAVGLCWCHGWFAISTFSQTITCARLWVACLRLPRLIWPIG